MSQLENFPKSHGNGIKVILGKIMDEATQKLNKTYDDLELLNIRPGRFIMIVGLVQISKNLFTKFVVNDLEADIVCNKIICCNKKSKLGTFDVLGLFLVAPPLKDVKLISNRNILTEVFQIAEHFRNSIERA